MWTPVYGFEELYEITKEGQIKSLRSNRIISQRYDNRGYLIVALKKKDGTQTTKGVHRLILETFNPVENMESLTVNHINHIKDDNRLENLEWMTNSDNVKEAYQAGLHKGTRHYDGWNNKAVVCIETGEEFASYRAAAKSLGIASFGKIGDACKSYTKTCGGYHWRYKEDTEKTLEKIMENLPNAIRCVETGEIFKSATDAGKFIGVTRKAVERACQNPNYTSKGLHWEKVNTKD